MEKFRIKDITYNNNGSKGEPSFHIIRFSCENHGKVYSNMIAVMPLPEDPDDLDVSNCFVVDANSPTEIQSADDYAEKLGKALKKLWKAELAETG